MIELGVIDIEGNIKTRSFLKKNDAMHGFGFDGSSLSLAPIEDSDLLAVPDASTKKVYKLRNEKIEFYLCNIFKDGQPYEIDLRKVSEDYLREYPYKVKVGAEVEFYILKNKHEKNNCYMLPYPLDEDKLLIREFMRELERLGYGVKLEHAEVGEGQHEITITHDEPSKIADKIAFYKYYAPIFFAQRGKTVSFKPKPFPNLNGNGMHLHISLEREGKKISFLKDKEGKSFLAGILKYIKEITIFLNQTENSYERLKPGFEAPCYISWGIGNRSALIRIPNNSKEKGYRFELRSPDPEANLYLGLIAILEAGRKGIEENLELEEQAKVNVYEDEHYRKRSLPSSLNEALQIAKRSELVKSLGKPFEKFLEVKAKTLKV